MTLEPSFHFPAGISVRDLLDQAGPLSCALVYEYLIQIVDATQHLHSRSIIYLNWTCEYFHTALLPPCMHLYVVKMNMVYEQRSVMVTLSGDLFSFFCMSCQIMKHAKKQQQKNT